MKISATRHRSIGRLHVHPEPWAPVGRLTELRGSPTSTGRSRSNILCHRLHSAATPTRSRTSAPDHQRCAPPSWRCCSFAWLPRSPSRRYALRHPRREESRGRRGVSDRKARPRHPAQCERSGTSAGDQQVRRLSRPGVVELRVHTTAAALPAVWKAAISVRPWWHRKRSGPLIGSLPQRLPSVVRPYCSPLPTTTHNRIQRSGLPAAGDLRRAGVPMPRHHIIRLAGIGHAAGTSDTGEMKHHIGAREISAPAISSRWRRSTRVHRTVSCSASRTGGTPFGPTSTAVPVTMSPRSTSADRAYLSDEPEAP